MMRGHERRLCVLVVLCACVFMTAPARAAPAAPAALEVPIQGASAEAPVLVHPGRITVFYLPERVVHVLHSSPDDYGVQFKGDRVVVRPITAPAPPANMVIRTEKHVVSVLLEPATSRAQAISHVVFVPEAAEAGARRAPSRLSLNLQGVFGRAVAGDTAMGTAVDKTLVAGAAARVAYRGSAFHAYEATLTLAHGGALRFEDVARDSYVGQMSRDFFYARLQGGASLRYGERFVPSLRVAAGVLGRALVAGRVRVYDERIVMQGPEDALLWDLAVTAGAGVEIRFRDRLHAGVSVTGTRIVTDGPRFESLEGAVHVRW